jgi:hypothetical protein
VDVDDAGVALGGHGLSPRSRRGRAVDRQSPPPPGFGGGAGLCLGGLAPPEYGGGGGERGHVPLVEAAVVGIGRTGRELGDDPRHPDLGDDRLSRLADFLVAEVGGRHRNADLVLFERLAGERGVTVGVERLRGSAWASARVRGILHTLSPEPAGRGGRWAEGRVGSRPVDEVRCQGHECAKEGLIRALLARAREAKLRYFAELRDEHSGLAETRAEGRPGALMTEVRSGGP